MHPCVVKKRTKSIAWKRCGKRASRKNDYKAREVAAENCWKNLDVNSVTSQRSPNVYKSWPKMIWLEKWKISTFLQKIAQNVGKAFQSLRQPLKLPKVK